jgi:hypothetical protein
MFLVALLALGRSSPCGAQVRVPSPDTDTSISEAKASALTVRVVGEWVGARLLCRKEEGGSVRCGKPVSFQVAFKENRTGSSTDEHFPNSFSYRWKSESEMVLSAVPGEEEITLFQLGFDEGYLTFQAYIYLALKDPSLPKEANYIHYIFDVHRVE